MAAFVTADTCWV